MNHLVPDLAKIEEKQLRWLQKQKIVLATTFYSGKAMGNYELSMGATMRWSGLLQLRMDVEHLFGVTYVQNGRNRLANKFMDETDATHLIFLDSDNGWIVNNLLELVLCTAEDRHIVGGLYPRRKINWKAVHAAVLAGVPPEHLEHCSGDFPMHALEGHDLVIGPNPIKVLTMPTGFLCITRKAFDLHLANWPEAKTTPGHPGHFGHEYFRAQIVDDGPAGKGWDSEDNIFCKDLLTCGINTWFCPWMNVSHFGEHLFEACLPCSMGHYVHFDLKEKPKLEVVK